MILSFYDLENITKLKYLIYANLFSLNSFSLRNIFIQTIHSLIHFQERNTHQILKLHTHSESFYFFFRLTSEFSP